MKKKNDSHSRIPLAELIQEGCDTHYLCEKDKADLVRHGIDWNLVEKLPLLTEQCSKAETAWQVCKGNKRVLVGELQDMARDAKKLRSKLARVLRSTKQYADSGHTLPAYSRRNSYPDIIQDLYELYIIASRFCKSSDTATIDSTIMESALKMHENLNRKYIKRAIYTNTLIDCVQQRNLTAQQLKSVLIDIHNAGKNVYIDNPEKASRYCIRYHLMYRTKNKHKHK